MTKIWSGILTAQSPIVHVGQTLGTVAYLRREKFLSSNNEMIEIPVVSGNSIRGALRDQAAKEYFDWLKLDSTPLEWGQLLYSGGAITKAKGDPLSGEELRQLRQSCPPLALFGGAVAGRVISGSLNIGKMLPICQETLPFLPVKISNSHSNAPELWDITQLSEYSRFPDVSEPTENAGLMRFGYESFVAGTKFYWWINVDDRNSTELLLARHLAHMLLDGELRVGGQKSTGHGVVVGDFNDDVDGNAWISELSQQYSQNEAETHLKKVR